MLILLVLVVTVNCYSIHLSGKNVDLGDVDIGKELQCDYGRTATLQALVNELDTNHDDCVSLDEMHRAFRECLRFVERIGLSMGSLFGIVKTPSLILATCDRNGDRLLCIDDILKTTQECLNTSSIPSSGCICDCATIEGLQKFIIKRSPCTTK